MRAYFSGSSTRVLQNSTDEILGKLVWHHPFPDDLEQKRAWHYEIDHFKEIARDHTSAHFFIEFAIPRMGKRADAVIFSRNVIFVVEYKVGETRFENSAIAQVLDYALDLKNFHEGSHDKTIVPVLVATHATPAPTQLELWEDRVAHPIRANRHSLSNVLGHLTKVLGTADEDPEQWAQSRYRPTPTIIEAAEALYRGHRVDEITRNEAGIDNLTRTADYVLKVINHAKGRGVKAICFVTGVPGSGKTLAGLNIATQRMKAPDEHAVFLSGNGPLVDVLREALAQDKVLREREARKATGEPTVRRERESLLSEARRDSTLFIQNIHHFRNEYVEDLRAPDGRVAVFDEAQRAWSTERTAQFMREKHAIENFDKSEPEFLLSVMDRHTDWCVVICLIGGGQEIHTGEVGLAGWFSALHEQYPHWQIHVSDKLTAQQLGFAEEEIEWTYDGA